MTVIISSCFCYCCAWQYNCIVLHYLCVPRAVSPSLQDSKSLFNPYDCTSRAQELVAEIPLSESQSLGNDHESKSLRFFSLPLGIGPNDEGGYIKWSSTVSSFEICKHLKGKFGEG